VFLRVLSATESSIGTTPVAALGRIDMRSMLSLVDPVKRLRARLLARVSSEASWQRFVDETGFELVSRSVRVFLDGTNAGGDADEIGRRSSLLGSKMNQLRDNRRLVAGSFMYLSMAMHAVIGFLLIFIVEVVNGFQRLILTAGADVPGGPGAALGSVLAFNQLNLAFLSYAVVPVLLVLGVVNAMGTQDRGRRVLVHDLLLLGHYHHVGRELDADRTDPRQPDLRYGRDLAAGSPRAEVRVYG
jgi:flagellar protein FlaJ